MRKKITSKEFEEFMKLSSELAYEDLGEMEQGGTINSGWFKDELSFLNW